MAVVDLCTFQDALEHLRDYASGAATTVESSRAMRRAILQAYSEIVSMRRWRYFYRQYRINTNAPYDTGTVEFDLTGGATCERQLTITTGTWPSWAGSGSIKIGDVVYTIQKRFSSTVVQIDAVSSPTADIASGTEYTLFQDTYTLPEDYLSMFRPHQETSDFWNYYVQPDEWQYQSRYNGSTGKLEAWTVMQDPRLVGRKAVYFYPYPDTAISYDFIYQKLPRPLRYSGFLTGETSSKSGTVGGTAGNTTVRGVSTVFASAMSGSVIRMVNSATAPEGLAGTTSPYLEQAIVDVVSTTGTLTVKTALVNTYAPGKGYTISDPIDLPPQLVNAFLSLCEVHYERLSGGDVRKAMEAFNRQFVLACDAESDYMGPRSAWDGNMPGQRRLAKHPLGPDV